MIQPTSVVARPIMPPEHQAAEASNQTSMAARNQSRRRKSLLTGLKPNMSNSSVPSFEEGRNQRRFPVHGDEKLARGPSKPLSVSAEPVSDPNSHSTKIPLMNRWSLTKITQPSMGYDKMTTRTTMTRTRTTATKICDRSVVL